MTEEPVEPETPTPVRRMRGPLAWMIAVSIVILAVGAWVFWDMRAWDRSMPAARSSHLKVLGRDDPATLQREAEERRPRFHPPTASASSSSSAPPPSSAVPASSVSTAPNAPTASALVSGSPSSSPPPR